MRYSFIKSEICPLKILIHSCVHVIAKSCLATFQVAEGYPPKMKRSLLLHFLNLFQSKQLGNDHLVVVMQMLILPVLSHAFQNGQSWEVVDPPIIKTIFDKLIDPPEEVYPGTLCNLLLILLKSYIIIHFLFVCI